MTTQRSDDPAPGRDGEQQMPRWVKGFVIATVAAVALVVALLVLGSGDDHGPDRRQPGGEQPTQTPKGHTPPVDHG